MFGVGEDQFETPGALNSIAGLTARMIATEPNANRSDQVRSPVVYFL